MSVPETSKRTTSVSEDNANTTAKESPLTDIAVSPPFDSQQENLMPSDVSSELSEIAADSEAETDKMDFFNGPNSDPPKESDLQVLSKLTELPAMEDSDVEEFMTKKRSREEDGDDENEREDNSEDQGEKQESNGKRKKIESRKSSPKSPSDNQEADDEDGDEEGDEDGDEDEVDLNEQRQLAIGDLIAIEHQFALLRDKLYHDKLSLLERELQLCLEGSHPELSKIYFKVNEFYQDNVKLANSNFSYRLKCIDRETMATRTSIHQNFLRRTMEAKNNKINETTSLWYKINKERNSLDQLVEDFGFSALPAPPVFQTGPDWEEVVVPNKRAVKQAQVSSLVHQRNSINHQLGVLNGLVEYSGFPRAVASPAADDRDPAELLLRKATNDEIQDDLRAMGII